MPVIRREFGVCARRLGGMWIGVAALAVAAFACGGTFAIWLLSRDDKRE